MKQENSRIKKEDERKMKEASNSVHKERGNKYINARYMNCWGGGQVEK